jgi:hypothetical protein
MTRRIPILIFILLFLGCDALSPTSPGVEPTTTPFNGRFTGNLGIRAPNGEDWTLVTLDLLQDGNTITGTLRDRNGRTHAVEGSVWFDAVGKASVTVKDIESNSCFSLGLAFHEVEYDSRTGNARALIGQIGGRCQGTVIQPFRLTRA